MSKLKHPPSLSSPSRPAHSLHLSTTHTFNSPQKQLHASPASPSQLDPFLSLIPSNRHSQARDAAQIFNNSVQRTSTFRARHPSNDEAARSPKPSLSSPTAAPPFLSNSRPATSACGSSADIDNSPAAKAERKLADDKRTELLFKKLTQDNPGILDKIKRMYIARNFSKQGASGYQPRKENYMQMSNNDAVEMLRAKIAQKLHSGPGELRRSFELFDRDGSGKVDIAELSEVLSMFNINLPPDQVFSLMCQFGASDGELDFNSFIKNVLAPVKILEVQNIGSKAKKLKGRQFLVGKNWINMHNDQVIAYLRQRIYQQYEPYALMYTRVA
jgi:Ca2+-binding EF-hand superfamily protein